MYQFGYFSALNFYLSVNNYIFLGGRIKSVIYCLMLWSFLSLINGHTLAQPSGSEWLELKNLDFQPHLPKYLLSRKSAVFVSVPRSKTNPDLREDWREFSEKVHQYFVKMKIDAVAYYYQDDVFASADANVSFAKEMERREIKYVIVVEKHPTNDAGVESYAIIITAFNDKPSIVSERQKAWKASGPVLDVLLNDMRKEVFRAEMKLGNYLVPDVPEYFTDTKILAGKRIQTYAGDLKVDKLVVPKFKKYQMEDSTLLDANTKQKIMAYNQEIDRKNRRLEQIMKTYPLDYTLSDTSSDDDIYNQGHQFVLLGIHGAAKSVKQMLNYETNAYTTDYVTIQANNQLKTLSVESVVHKYYVKHVYTKDVYLGSRWDADLTWEEALQNFIFHMKDVLKLQ